MLLRQVCGRLRAVPNGLCPTTPLPHKMVERVLLSLDLSGVIFRQLQGLPRGQRAYLLGRPRLSVSMADTSRRSVTRGPNMPSQRFLPCGMNTSRNWCNCKFSPKTKE